MSDARQCGKLWLAGLTWRTDCRVMCVHSEPRQHAMTSLHMRRHRGCAALTRARLLLSHVELAVAVAVIRSPSHLAHKEPEVHLQQVQRGGVAAAQGLEQQPVKRVRAGKHGKLSREAKTKRAEAVVGWQASSGDGSAGAVGMRNRHQHERSATLAGACAHVPRRSAPAGSMFGQADTANTPAVGNWRLRQPQQHRVRRSAVAFCTVHRGSTYTCYILLRSIQRVILRSILYNA
jgi:hypothetical protein